MCKIMGLTNAKKIDIQKATNIVGELVKSQTDGFGFFATHRDGGVYIQRQTKLPWRWIAESPMLKYTKNCEFNSVGMPRPSGEVEQIFWHGRTSTNSLGLQNTHPISKNYWHLIHNGVVNNRGKVYERQCQTDTEHLVQLMSTEGIESIERDVSGYYAFVALDPQNQLHIVKDNIAPLCVAWLDSIESYIFASTENLIEDFCYEMNIAHSKIDSLVDNTYLVMRGNTILSAKTIKPRGYDYNESKWSNRSLGYGLQDWPSWDPYDDYVPSPSPKPENKSNSVSKNDALWYDISDDYLNMLSSLDSSYEIYSAKGKRIAHKKFIKMQLKHKVLCTVVRYDGLVIDPYKRVS